MDSPAMVLSNLLCFSSCGIAVELNLSDAAANNADGKGKSWRRSAPFPQKSETGS
jgi:hypothetical protein